MSTQHTARQISKPRPALPVAPKAAPLPKLELLLADAKALDAKGKNAEARQAYLKVLALDSKHLEALLGFSSLCGRTGYSAAAKTALWQALQVQPQCAAAHANVATLLSDAGEPQAARDHYEQALRLDPGNQAAHQGLAILLLRQGELAAARHHGQIGLRGAAEAWPFRGTGRPISLLVTFSAVGGNLPIDAFLDDRVFLKWMIIPEFFDSTAQLPPHDLVFNGIGDADRCGDSLAAVASIFARTQAPILNAPEKISRTSRVANAQRLASLPGVKTARTVEWTRAELSAPDVAEKLNDAGFTWPLLLRSPGYHTGQHFVKVDSPQDLQAAVDSLPGDSLLVLQYIDSRSPDGKFRKYRVMLIDNEIYPLHLAVASQWKVHYLSADMADHPAHRAEDAAFLADLPGTVGAKAMQTLASIRDLLGLDYGGIDFALDAEGNVIVFEANATMVILPPDADARWAYRAAPVERAQAAVRTMLLRRAGARPVETP